MNVQLTIDKGVGTVILSNPPLNAMVSPVFIDPVELTTFLSDSRLKVVLIKGAGRHFSSGADLSEMRKMADNGALLNKQIDTGKLLLQAINNAMVPVIAVIKGSCFGGGLELALACHFRIASKHAMFGFPESTHNLLPGLGGTVYLKELVSRNVAVDLLLSGKMIGAEEALKIGLIHYIENTSALDHKVEWLINHLTEKRSPLLIRSIMTALQNARNLPVTEALQKETVLFCSLAEKLSIDTDDLQ